MHDCKLSCDDVSVIDYETCACIKTANSEIERKKRSSDGVSTLIRGVDEITTHRCSNNEKWNGSACISTVNLCPGGYHRNGHTCIIQTLIETAVLIPSAPDTKCKYAKQKEKEAERMQMPLTVMPTFATSPMCQYGFVWMPNSGCVRNPVCPTGYAYYNNVCHYNPQPLRETVVVETTTHTSLPSSENTSNQNSINGNKWQPNPIAKNVNVELSHKIETENDNSSADEGEEEISYNKNGQRCCSIMTPRICRRISNNLGEKWQCYHQKYRRCGNFCTKPTIYLRPKRVSFNEPILIMPPPTRLLMKLLQNHVFRETNIGM